MKTYTTQVWKRDENNYYTIDELTLEGKGYYLQFKEDVGNDIFDNGSEHPDFCVELTEQDEQDNIELVGCFYTNSDVF